MIDCYPLPGQSRTITICSFSSGYPDAIFMLLVVAVVVYSVYFCTPHSSYGTLSNIPSQVLVLFVILAADFPIDDTGLTQGEYVGATSHEHPLVFARTPACFFKTAT